MNVFVTGGTGFVGPAVVRALLGEGHEVTALVHKRRGTLPEATRLRTVEGDVGDANTYAKFLGGHEAVVHLVAIRRGSAAEFERLHVEATRQLLHAARRTGATRVLYMSAHGVERRGTPYQRTKHQAEELVKGSGMDWTIFRPTFITGPKEGDAEGFDHEFAAIAKSSPVLPSFAGGKFLLQPVAKRDVAVAFARALTRPVAHGRTYVLAGPEALTWDGYLRRLCKVLGVKRPLAPVPGWLVLPAAGVLGGLSPASPDELRMLFEGHAGDASEAARDLDVAFQDHPSMLREALAG